MGIITIPGTFTYSGIQSAAIRAQHRLLDLTGQIISITGTYAALAANVYAGDAANPSAGAFYKCDASGNRTTSGAYMKMPDCRGIFLRGAGSQTRTITWTDAQGVSHSINTLYDGKEIGAFIGDAIRDITGGLSDMFAGGAASGWEALRWVDQSPRQDVPWQQGYSSRYGEANFSSSRKVPTAGDNHPASINAMICITY
jgi:hypothetical protein